MHSGRRCLTNEDIEVHVVALAGIAVADYT